LLTDQRGTGTYRAAVPYRAIDPARIDTAGAE